MESEERQKAWQSKLQKCVALSTTKAELGFVQDEHWLFCDSQSADMMTKVRRIFIHYVVSPHWWWLIGFSNILLPSHHQSDFSP
ncbi:hypothetical protein CR513_26442, partial [Mucuna pruriens]